MTFKPTFTKFIHVFEVLLAWKVNTPTARTVTLLHKYRDSPSQVHLLPSVHRHGIMVSVRLSMRDHPTRNTSVYFVFVYTSHKISS